MGNSKQGLRLARNDWKGMKKGACVIFFAWVLCVMFFSLPWKFSDCWKALVMGNIESQRGINLLKSNFTLRPENRSAEGTGLEHIVFGIGSSAKNWEKRKQLVDIWWQPGITRGYVWLDRVATGPRLKDSSPPIKISEDTSHFKYTNRDGHRSAIRIARIVSETFRLGLPNVRWFVMGDDDTVFFVENLVRVLSRYDHNQYYYIGTDSECSLQNMAHTHNMAFGGAGFAISYPLARALAKIQDNCLHRYSHLFGSDHRVQACLAELGVPLTKQPGFHQVDLHGSLFGLLASHPIAPLLSLHHFDVVEPIFPFMTRDSALKHLMKAARIDSGRVLQQSICYDKRRNWTVSASWGYCVQIMNGIQPPNILEYPVQTFRSWSKNGRTPFMFKTRPIPKKVCQIPNILFMKTVKNTAQNVVSNYENDSEIFDRIHGKCNSNPNNLFAIDKVTVLSQKMRLLDRSLAPRRQCCDINSTTTHSMKIIVRDCSNGESVFG